MYACSIHTLHMYMCVRTTPKSGAFWDQVGLGWGSVGPLDPHGYKDEGTSPQNHITVILQCLFVSVFLRFCASMLLCFCAFVIMCFCVCLCLCISLCVCVCVCFCVCVCVFLIVSVCF